MAKAKVTKAKKEVKVERKGFTHQEWLDLCAFVETNVMEYDANIKPPRSLYLRLRGLSEGKFMANKHIPKQAEYSYQIILLTFKYSMLSIKKAIATKDFKDEQNKLNYIMVIIESNINDIYNRMKKNEQSKVKTEQLDLSDNEQPKNYFDNSDKKSSKVSSLLDEDIW